MNEIILINSNVSNNFLLPLTKFIITSLHWVSIKDKIECWIPKLLILSWRILSGSLTLALVIFSDKLSVLWCFTYTTLNNKYYTTKQWLLYGTRNQSYWSSNNVSFTQQSRFWGKKPLSQFYSQWILVSFSWRISRKEVNIGQPVLMSKVYSNIPPTV